MKIKARSVAALAMAVAAGVVLAGCSGSGSSGSSSQSDKGVTLQYWATNQAASVDGDVKILTPELKKFQKQTGIKVNLQVIPWSTIDTKILAAATSGKGPDVFNLGNTNAHTYAETGALMPFNSAELKAIGGKSRYIAPVYATTGPAPVTSVPLYSQAYGLFYNKKMFADAGISTPPTTWEELMSDAKKLTNPSAGTYGVSIQGASVAESMHFAYIFGIQNGGAPFNSKDQPTFTNSGVVNGALQYLNLMQDGVVNPSDAQFTSGTQQLTEFAQNKAGMVMDQNGVLSTLASLGMTPSQYGVVPIPSPDPLPKGGKKLASFVAGTNIAVFKNTKYKDAALKFVKFMTSPSEQTILDKKYQLLPVLKNSSLTFMSDQTTAKAFTNILANLSEPLPVTADNNSYQTNIGGSVMSMMGKAATGTKLSASDIKTAFAAAQQQMPQQ